MAKVKVQVDLTKSRPRHVWIGLDDEDLTIGRWQPIEYENIPPYYVYCNHQDHMTEDCNFKIRDEDFKRRKELGAEIRNMNHGEQGQQGQDQRQGKQTEDIQEQHNNARTTIQEPQNRSKTDYKQTAQTKQTKNQANNKGTGIDSMLPIPISPHSSPLNGIIEVEGGMDGGCRERHTNLQERGSKGGNLTHVLHEGTHLDHSPELRSPATTTI
ncbi:hypothetical protein H5410_050948 [Solanum commersonii]|uniref:Uncharacterized protein n=1 Tax=Solanum commersonii TaxID=4109 RepID=A0A9J5WWV0_SOLCO|nr:hypothetical protein H5410_050948 [Solanum commersonii]